MAKLARRARFLSRIVRHSVLEPRSGETRTPVLTTNGELDWWQHFGADAGFNITHTPSRHWGARMLRDFHRGYGGYVIRTGRHSVYHAGDTAYFPGFREIGRRLAPELALLPIGAYSPPG